ncbi:MAG: TIGR02099 family protein [Rhodocyclaceae bacterium]|nr:TIGR02099 family protein [Rhodocyclaceae bacterium]
MLLTASGSDAASRHAVGTDLALTIARSRSVVPRTARLSSDTTPPGHGTARPLTRLQRVLRSLPVRLAIGTHRWLWWIASAVLVLLLLAHALLRFWLVPQIPERRVEIEAALAEAIQRPVRLGEIRAGWSGLQPRIDIASLTILDRAGQPALVLPAINASLSWRSLPARTVVFGRLRTGGLELFLHRARDGTVLLGDIPLNRGEDNRFLDWLQQQRGIDLERSVIHWDDESRAAPRLTLRDVDLRIRNRGALHRFGLRATPPDTLAGPLDLRGEWRGESVARQEGRGRLYGELESIDLASLLPWIDLPFGVTAGRGDLRLWLDLHDSTVAGFTADARLVDVSARIEGTDEALQVRSLGGRVALLNRPDRHALELQRLTLQTTDGVVAPETTLQWRQEGRGDSARHTARIEHVVLGPLFQALSVLPLPEETRQLIREAAPRGELRNVRAQWQGDWRNPRRYSLRGRFSDLGMAPVAGLPGFDRLSGSIDASEAGGRAQLGFGAAPLSWPGHFRRALPLQSAEATLDWRREKSDWRYELAAAGIDTGELRASLQGSWVPAKHELQLDVHASHLDPAAVVHYLPESVGEGTREWLELAFPAGGQASGTARLRGDPARFPFSDGRGGRFEAAIDLRVPALLFSPRWPRLQTVEGRLRFVNAAVAADGARGRLGNSVLEQIRMSIPNLEIPDPALDISGQVAASVPDVLDYIQNSPVRGLINGATDGMSGNGRVGLKLALHVPLHHSLDATLKGEAAIDAGRLELGPGRPALTALSGPLLFTEQGVSSPGLAANFLGGPARGVISSQPGGIVRIEASGRARIASLAQQFPLRAWGLAAGEAAWRGDISLGPAGTRLNVQSGLEGVVLDLPAPLAKPAPQNQPLRFVWQTGERGDRYDLDIGTQIRARVQTRAGVAGVGSSVDKALVAVGAAALPADRARGVAVAIDLPQFFATQWLPVFDRFTASGPETGAPLPVEARIRTRRFELEGQFLGETDLAVERHATVWNWTVRGADAEGGGLWDPTGNGAITARLARLSLGAPVDGATPPQDDEAGNYPALDVEVGSFLRRGRDFGQLRLKASQQGRDWQIDALRLSAPEYQLDASGVWQAWRSRPATDIKVELRTTDTGRYLDRLGYRNVLKAAPASLKGTLRWRGPPTDIDFPSLSGQFHLETGKGQFLKAEPGAARLLGIVSLQALPRRITLDFRDVFSEGLLFDSIESDLALNEGVMRTDQFFIDAPAAKVRIKGQANLARETQDLQVKVSPAMDAATIGALIANPVAGLAVFLAQQLLDDPIGKLITFNYYVTGSWADPQVSRRGAPELSTRPKTEREGKDGASTVLPGGAP